MRCVLPPCVALTMHSTACGLRGIATRIATLLALILSSDAVQPDKPQLARFWLAAVMSGLRLKDPREVSKHCLVLTCFLWWYTWAALPTPLRRDLRLALQRLWPLRVKPPYKAQDYNHVSTLISVLDTDPAFGDPQQADEETKLMAAWLQGARFEPGSDEAALNVAGIVCVPVNLCSEYAV